MKNLAVVCSLLSLIVLQIRMFRLPSDEIPAFTCVFLFAQSAFTFVALLSSKRIGWHGKAYEDMFFVCLWATLATAVLLAFSLARPIAALGFSQVVFTAIILSSAVCLIAMNALGVANQTTRLQLKYVASCGVLLFCGFVALASLFYPAGKVTDLLRLFLGIFWTCQAIYGFFCPMAVIRNRAALVRQIDFIPTLIAIVVFSCLTWSLSKSQYELSRQHDQSIVFPPADEQLAETVPAIQMTEII
jgi:hypothetical protein